MQMLRECYLKDINFPFKLNDRFVKSFSELSRVSFVLGLGLLGFGFSRYRQTKRGGKT